MKDQNKTNAQLINEVMELRQRIAKLEAFEADHTRVDEDLHNRGN
jgi:Fe-S-cluster formation regulator IscX/YfhJ